MQANCKPPYGTERCASEYTDPIPACYGCRKSVGCMHDLMCRQSKQSSPDKKSSVRSNSCHAEKQDAANMKAATTTSTLGPVVGTDRCNEMAVKSRVGTDRCAEMADRSEEPSLPPRNFLLG